MIIILLLGGFYVGWNIGANDTANCIGTSVGSGLLPYKKAIFLVSFAAILGALLQSQNVMKTIGKGIVTEQLSLWAILAALLSAGVFVTLATFFSIPVSTSQAIVGGVTGVGFSAGATVDIFEVVTIVQVWVICPFLTAIMAFGIYHFASFFLNKVRRTPFWDRVLSFFVILSAGYVAFSLGANDVGNSVGPLSTLGISPIWLALLGGIALSTGVLTYGRRVTETVGGGITPLDPLSAVAAQTSAALAVHFFSIIGIPVSTSQAIVGAVVGVGLVKGMGTVSTRKVIEIVTGWVASPTLAGIFSFGLYRFISLLLG